MSLVSDTIPIKSLTEGTKVPRSLIAPSIREGEYSDAWNFFGCHCKNGSSQIKGIDLDQLYSPVAQADLLRINIAIASMHLLTVRILDVSSC